MTHNIAFDRIHTVLSLSVISSVWYAFAKIGVIDHVDTEAF
jgi:hypothetical protein